MIEFPARIAALRRRLGLSQRKLAERMRLSMSYVHQLENGKRPPTDAVEKLVRMLEQQIDAGMISTPDDDSDSAQTNKDTNKADRKIRVLSWAHAGQATNYEEIPEDWQDEICTDCTDPKAFALRLEGNSMESKKEPSFASGDLLVVMPSKRPYSGCFVACRFVEDGGILFRELETVGNTIRLIPLNERYQITEHQCDEFEWMYPVWGRWTQLWKG